MYILDLKVLTNEKRGGFTMLLFDRSPFKLFTLKFSNKSIQSSSCERHKTTQRTLFLLFESNSWFPITLWCRRCVRKSGKLVSHVANSYIAIGSLPTLLYKSRWELSRYLKRIMMESRSLTSSQTSGRITIPLLQWRVICEKCAAARHYAVIGKQ